MRNLQATVTNYHSPITSHEPLSLVNMLAIAVFLACLFPFCSNAGAHPYAIDRTGVSDVNGIYGSGDLSLIGSDFGYVKATATNSNAWGIISSGGNITITGAFGIGGLIFARAGTNEAYGLASWDGLLTTCAINGRISATATNGSDAYAMYSDPPLIINGDITGTISAYANGSNAYALYSDDSILVNGDITSTATISATAGDSYAAGLYSDGPITTGAINGMISATAGTDYVLGLFSDGSLTTGSINGTISATATDGSDARALYSYYDLATGNIGSSARITAMAEENDAYGLRSFGSITTGAINGTISATAGDKYAYGLYSDRWIDTDAIDGTITATAGTDYAYGLYSNGSLYTGNINGTITATAGDRYAYGLYSNGSLYTGNINGTISATAGEDSAFGLFTYGSITTGVIRGTIDASAGGDYAYGILSYGPMNVTIDGGTVSAVADDGTNVAAIQSGNADDRVNITAGSRIVGNIDLARTTDDDTLILSGVNTNSTTLDYDIKNVENIYITGGRWHINGTVSGNANGIEMSGGILSGTGTLGSLNVTGGTLAPGNSIGTMTVNGDLTLGPAAVFEVDVNNGSADKVIVTGTAYLDGTIRVKALECIDHPFAVTVIDANTGLSGKFADVNTAFLNYTVSYDMDNHDVILNVEPIEIEIECDFDCNGKVNFEDLARLADLWLWVGPAGTIPEDLIQDGTVNFPDFAICAEHWLKGTTP